MGSEAMLQLTSELRHSIDARVRLPLGFHLVLADHTDPALLLSLSLDRQPRHLTLTPARKADAIKPEPRYRKLAPSAGN
jgi:hypothetical protein